MSPPPFRFLPVFACLLCVISVRGGPDPANRRALAAAEAIGERLSGLEDRDFFQVPARRTEGYRGFPVSPETTYLQLLRSDLRSAFAEIALAKDDPTVVIDSDRLLEAITRADRRGFFDSRGHQDVTVFRERMKILEKAVLDDEPGLPDLVFSLLGRTGEDGATILSRWLARMSILDGEFFLGSPKRLGSERQARCLRELFLFGVAIRAESVSRLRTDSPESWQTLQDFLDGEFTPAVIEFSRRRFEEDGPLRDLSLPVFEAAAFVDPRLTREKAGITTHLDLQKYAVPHARGMADLIRAIDAPMADTAAASKAISQILTYRIQPFYAGSGEVREKKTLPCPPDRELELIVSRADFFGRHGHRDDRIYKRRVEILEQLFLRPSAQATRDGLFALKTPAEWVDYFRTNLLGSGSPGGGGCLSSIENSGAVSLRDLKNLFLARCVLTHPAYDANPGLSQQRDGLFGELQAMAPRLAIRQFQHSPHNWDHVDLAFVEMAKLLPEFDLTAMGVPTYRNYLTQSREFRRAMEDLPEALIGLCEPDSPHLLGDEVELFASDHLYRIGKFNKRLHPDFIKQINGALETILVHRESPYSPPDTERRPGLATPGDSLYQLRVANLHAPETAWNNTILHDLVEGPKGGLGGFGELFHHDPLGYESCEFALDAVARSTDLLLDEALFALAMDIGVAEPGLEERVEAASRWLRYFSKTQSEARFHASAEELRKAIRGAYLGRLVIQSDAFCGTMEELETRETSLRDDFDVLLEKTLRTQVRIMSNLLSSVDPSTALNKDTEYIKKRWYLLKAWHTESMKWLESLIADPLLMAGVQRVRSGSDHQPAPYGDIVPSIRQFEFFLSGIDRNPEPPGEGAADPVQLAGELAAQLLAAETRPTQSIETDTDLSHVPNRMGDLSEEVARRLHQDIRVLLDGAGFGEFCRATSPEDIPGVTVHYGDWARDRSPEEVLSARRFLVSGLQGAISRAKASIEAERVTDLRKLEDLSIRVSRADRIFYAGDPERYSLLVDPSLLLHEWNNRQKIEVLVQFRTAETRAQAQTQIYRTRRERRDLELERELVYQDRIALQERLEKARSWAAESGLEFDPEAVIDEVIAKEDRIAELEKAIARYQDLEARLRQQHIHLAQQLRQSQVGNARLRESIERDLLLAQSERPRDEPPNREEPVAIFERGPAQVETMPIFTRPPIPEPRTRSSSRGNFFQRLFGGRGRR